MKKKLSGSMYTRFIAFFLGAFLISIIITALFTYFTQMHNIRSFVSETIEYRADSLKALVYEEGISVEDASKYLTSIDLKITTNDSLDSIYDNLSSGDIERINNGETLIRINPDKSAHILAVLEVEGEYVFISPDLKNNPISQFKIFQRTSFFLPIILGTIFIAIVVAMVVKPIKAISAASKEVAGGNFDVEVEVKGNDEIADLSRNFNLMVKELAVNEYLHKDFVSNVSHEFRTPITSLMGYAKLLKNEDKTDKEKNEYADIIISESERLSNLSSNLLKLSALGNERIISKNESFQLDEQIRDAILLLQNQWEKKNLELDLKLDTCHFTGDKELLYQVWINLISNAIKYSNDNGRLAIGLKKTDLISVEIIDKGIGMTKEEQEKIFLRFYKADKSRNIRGTGLGLTIAKEIVELHGGSILVESEIDKGSRFLVVLKDN